MFTDTVMQPQNDPYAKVQSLYGPGTVGAWLLTILSVFLTWTLNRKARCRDTLSFDFLAVLILPTVAASHLFWLARRLPTSIAGVLVAEDLEAVQNVAALEAPLNICETFLTPALILSCCCGPWYNSKTRLKRLSLTITAGLLSWATEQYMFIHATGIGLQSRDIVLSRPYIFMVAQVFGLIWAFLSVIVLFPLLEMAVSCYGSWTRSRQTKGSNQPSDVEMALTQLRNVRAMERREDSSEENRSSTELRHDMIIPSADHASGTVTRVDESATSTTTSADAERPALLSRTWDGVDRVSARLSTITIMVIPLSFTASCVISMGHTKGEMLNFDPALEGFRQTPGLFFIPRSSGRIQDLDQALALAGGMLVLAYAMVDIWRTRDYAPCLHTDE